MSKYTYQVCGEKVNLNLEGNTHRDGSVSHEACADSDTFERENAADADGGGK